MTHEHEQEHSNSPYHLFQPLSCTRPRPGSFSLLFHVFICWYVQMCVSTSVHADVGVHTWKTKFPLSLSNIFEKVCLLKFTSVSDCLHVSMHTMCVCLIYVDVRRHWIPWN